MSQYFRFSLFTFLLVCTLVCVAVGVAFRPPPPPSLAIQIVSIDPRCAGLHRDFHVVITNQSDRNVRLWEERISLGYYNLTFELFDSKGKSIGTIEKNLGKWLSSNFPRCIELAPNQHHVIDVYFSGKKWATPIEPIVESEGPIDYRLVATYTVSECADSREHSVWTGTIKTDPVNIKLGSWRYSD